jgi:hypothetical protein
MTSCEPALVETNSINIPLQLGDDDPSLVSSAESENVKQIYQTENVLNNQLTDLGAGDTTLYTHFLSPEEAAELFHSLLQEQDFQFQQWYRMPSSGTAGTGGGGLLTPLRRVKIAMAKPEDDGQIPYFRFPVNNQSSHGLLTPMPPIIETIRQRLSTFLNCELNHAVVLLYRDDEDCIGYHKDKPLDLDDEAPIATVSLGFARTYSLRDRIHNPKRQQTFLLPSGSLLALGPQTNQQMFHSILPIRSLDNLSPQPPPVPSLSCEEEATSTSSSSPDQRARVDDRSRARISLTFRRVVTFLDPLTRELRGKGAQFRSLDWPEELSGVHLRSSPP